MATPRRTVGRPKPCSSSQNPLRSGTALVASADALEQQRGRQQALVRGPGPLAAQPRQALRPGRWSWPRSSGGSPPLGAGHEGRDRPPERLHGGRPARGRPARPVAPVRAAGRPGRRLPHDRSPGPEPATSSSAMPCSSARRRASGDARTWAAAGRGTSAGWRAAFPGPDAPSSRPAVPAAAGRGRGGCAALRGCGRRGLRAGAAAGLRLPPGRSCPAPPRSRPPSGRCGRAMCRRGPPARLRRAGR